MRAGTSEHLRRRARAWGERGAGADVERSSSRDEGLTREVAPSEDGIRRRVEAFRAQAVAVAGKFMPRGTTVVAGRAVVHQALRPSSSPAGVSCDDSGARLSSRPLILSRVGASAPSSVAVGRVVAKRAPR